VKIGYNCVSCDKQTTALHEDTMQRESCERVLTDKQKHIL